MPDPLISIDELTLSFNIDHASISSSVPDWNLRGFSCHDPLAFDPSIDVAFYDPSPRSQKEAKQWELMVVQQRLFTLQSELNATP